jgi:hypothetical protein
VQERKTETVEDSCDRRIIVAQQFAIHRESFGMECRRLVVIKCIASEGAERRDRFRDQRMLCAEYAASDCEHFVEHFLRVLWRARGTGNLR